MRTAEEYKESVRRMRRNIYKFDELIEDVTTHPATRNCIEGHAQIFAAAQSTEYRDLLTTTSNFTGERISRYLSLMQSSDDVIANCRLKRLMFNLTGSCTGGRCVGWNALNAMWATTFEMDSGLGTDYNKRLKDWLIEAQRKDITVAGALTDPKGNRGLQPSKQNDSDMYLRLVEERKDGIVVRGAKIMIAGVCAANEILVLPGTALKEEDRSYAISFVIPRDIEGLTIVEARHPSDGREGEEGFDIPVRIGGITQSYLFFEDVFVPKNRVFMCGECKFALQAVSNFIMPYRTTIGGCVAGQGDVMMGAAVLMARANGLNEKAFSEKLTEMCVNNETTFAMGVAASALGKKHPSGVWSPDPLLSNVNKVHVATLPYQTKRLTQEICGGIGETGCMPSSKDYQSDRYGKLIQKYLKANVSAETRMRIARLVEWLTIGAGVPGTMHGGGSPEGAKLVIRSNTDIERYVSLAKRLAGIEEDVKKVEK